MAGQKLGVSYADCLRALEGDDLERAEVMRSWGGKPDDWRLVETRERMALALTGAEDRLELRRGSGAAAVRALVRAVRRRVEESLPA
jgi:hypothetical protein